MRDSFVTVTQPGAPLAYSEILEPTELPARRSSTPVVLFVASLFALGAAISAWWLPTHRADHPVTVPVAASGPTSSPITAPTVTTVITSPSVPSATTVMLPAPTVTITTSAPRELVPAMDADDMYVARISQDGMIILNRAAAIENGHRICGLLSSGYTESQIIAALMRTNIITAADSVTTISAATDIYCPQYRHPRRPHGDDEY